MKISHILQESPQLCPECGGPAFGDLLLAEKKDACYSKVRSRYKVWPSAYASGALVQCRKKGAANWGNKNESEDDNFGKPAALMTASPEALKTAQDIVQKQADKNVISQAKIAGAVPYQGVAEGLGKDLKRLATGKDVKSRAGQEIAKSQQASMTGDNKTAHKHFKRYDKLDKLANKGVAEGSLNEVTQGVEHSEWADNVKNAYYPTAVRIVKKRTEDGRHIKSQAIANGKLVGQYNMNTGVGTFTNPKKKGVAEGTETEGTATLAKIAAAGDNGYDMIEDGLNGLLGTEAQIMLQDMYDDVSREHRLHPDDDFEQIYDRMMDRIESDYGQQGVAENLGLRNLRNTLSGIPKTRYAQDQAAQPTNRRPTPQELDRRKQAEKDKKPGVAEGSENNPVADAMFARLQQRPDLLRRHGVEYVIQAVHDVADSVGAVDEIGSSDVSGWMRQLEWNLKNKLNQYDEPMRDIDRLEEVRDEKIGGRHDPEEFDAMIGRLRQLAGAGPLKTVWDEKKRVYRNVPTAQQPNKGSQSNA